MARMPGAIWKPLAADWNQQPRMKAYDLFCLHTMVGSLNGTDGYFKVGNGAGYGGTESHFGVGPDGTIYQWQDTAYQADANGAGNWHVISSENADTGTPFPKWGGSDVPAFTPEQVEANARIATWLLKEHGIPLDVVPDAKPGRRGMAYHRQGVPGYMVAGAEKWSSAPGKVCPGDRRIAQVPAVSARAKQIANGDEEFSVAAADEIKALIKGYGGRTENTERMVADIQAKTVGYGRRTENAERDARIAAAGVADLNQKLVGYGNRIENTEARVVALEAAVKAMAPGVNLSEEQVGEAVAKALRDNVVKVAVDVAGSVK